MKSPLRRIVFWSLLALVVLGGLAYAFKPVAVPVDLVTARRGPLIVTIEDEGKTRVREVYVLSAPIGGQALRIDAQVGEEVTAGESVLAEIMPEAPAFLDVRSEAQARASVEAAGAARTLAEADLQRARAELAFAEAELGRVRPLFANKTVAKRTLDEAQRSEATARATVRTAEAALRMRNSELEEARARLITANEAAGGERPGVPVRAPVNGRVLRVLHESEGVVRAGEPLAEIGDPGDLEIVVDLLSSDAVKVRAGQRVEILAWGGEETLEGRVRRVEPFGFTEVSALGIEEQRVNVIIDFVTPNERWRALGHGYQLTAAIVISEAEALIAPLSALFRTGADWSTFVVEDGRARQRAVTIGRLSRDSAEVLGGLSEGDVLIAHPSDRIADGVQVETREGG
jgi:HlyD family secretion protein